MPGVLEIIKKRFSELVMLIVLWAGLWFVSYHMQYRFDPNDPDGGFNISRGALFFLAFSGTFFQILLSLATLGFLVSIYLHRTQGQDPVYLVRLGRAFFWRTVRLFLVIVLFMMSIIMILIAIYTSVTKIQDPTLPKWLAAFFTVVTVIILMKPILLCLPLMITRNCMVGQSFGLLIHYRIRNMLPLIGHGLIWLAPAVSLDLAVPALDDNKILFNTVLAIRCIVFSAGFNIIAIHALRYVILSEAERIQSRRAAQQIDTAEIKD